MGVYAVRAHIDWKYALSLELTDPGFDFSVLSEFRARVLTDDGAQRILDPVLQCLRDQHLLKARGTAAPFWLERVAPPDWYPLLLMAL